uniref:Uncharacterized protein n=1 Tax=Lepeophtheirus salmonis TaxID=72036 RepID=A0A0K2T833_LEPSM
MSINQRFGYFINAPSNMLTLYYNYFFQHIILVERPKTFHGLIYDSH